VVRRDLDGAFHDLVVTEGPSLYRLARLLSEDSAAAEDLVQDALVRAWKSWPRVCAAEDRAAYVRRILVNAARTGWRRRWRVESPRGMISAPSAHDAYEQVDDREQLIEALGVLAPRQRAAIVLRYFCDLDDATIADLLGCSRATVRSHVSRALAQLRIAESARFPDHLGPIRSRSDHDNLQ
jgi:RNA polymerase sigma-70 factor (sigma-E family)